MTAFIVRPFNKKDGVDFEKVDRELITPALDRLRLTGRTTQEIAKAGNIRADMFQLLLTADIVIADISIHNANVFYELGVRHALRDKWTVLLRASIDDVPFDLRTDRYLGYDPANPAASLEALVETLNATRRSGDCDSPVYSMVPGLKAPDASLFVVVPNDFREEVRRAEQKCQRGDLRFLASEVAGLRWKREGLRIVGEAQFQLRDLKYAAETFESVRAELPDDPGANLRLGSIYQKMRDLIRSDEAVRRVAAMKDLCVEELAEARALLGSNAKTRWVDDWSKVAPEERQAEALRSPFLFDALESYRDGFEVDPRHYYSGLNALALVTLLIELATERPDVWQERYKPAEAAFRLEEYRELRAQLAGAVEFALLACKERLTRESCKDPWIGISFADLAFLTGRSNARQLYRDSIRDLGPFTSDTARRQFEIFRALGVFKPAVNAIATVFGPEQTETPAPKKPTVLLFTGHRVDDPDRLKPRFPASAEAIAREAIRNAVQAEFPATPGAACVALSGGASGGDLLFHETCEEFAIERHMYLIVERDEYVAASVAPAGPQWIARFDRQHETATVREYQRSKELPAWLQDKPNYGVWQRSNAWMLYNALAIGGTRTTVIALWDGQGGDGPGGTEHMVNVASARGARTIILNSRRLFGL